MDDVREPRSPDVEISTHDLTRDPQGDGMYRQLFDSSLDGILLIGPNGTIFDANPTACVLLAMSKEEICAAGRQGVTVPGSELEGSVGQLWQAGRVSAETTCRRNGGDTFPAEFTSFVLPTADGSFLAFLVFRDISERKKAEEALRESEVRLVRAQAVAHVGSWEFDLAAGTIWTSEEAFRINGIARPSSAVDRDYLMTFTVPEDRPRLVSALQDLIAAGTPYDLEFRIARSSDGAERILHSTADVIRDEEGVPVKVVGVLQDVTELRRAEERLRLTQYAVDHARDSIVWTDSQGRVIWFNDANCRSLGYTREELTERSIFLVDTRLDKDRWDRLWSRLKNEGGFTFETELQRKNGETFPVEVSLNYLNYGGREFNCSFVRDISERRQMEERATWLSRILDESLDEVYLSDAETFRFVQVNKGAQRNLGYTMDELVRMTPVDLAPPLAPVSLEEMVAPLRSGAEQQIVFTGEQQRKDGSVYPVEVHLQLNEQGPRPMFMAICLDITARKAAEEALNGSEERLRQSQKMEAIGQLAGGIAHDFNNLLTAILGYTEILLAGPCGENSACQPDLEQIKRAAERAGALTRQILAFSRRQALRPRVVRLNEILEGMEPLLRRSLGEDIELVCDLQPGLGLVELDAHQFEQVLMNLAVNARDAMPTGGRLTFATADVEVDKAFTRAHPEFTPGNYVTVSATDTGVGMDAETMSRIYEPFFTTKEPGKGTGLGLSTAYGIVRQSGGSITVESDIGRGSTFTVYLPRVSPNPPSPEETPSASSSTRRGETVMVVEDEPAVRSLVARVLSNVGHTVIEAGSGAEAFGILQALERPPDLLLTDLVLPGGMRGHELADMMRSSASGLPVVFMSGYSQDTVVNGGRIEEGVGFLQKPFTAEKLAQTVREALDKSH